MATSSPSIPTSRLATKSPSVSAARLLPAKKLKQAQAIQKARRSNKENTDVPSAAPPYVGQLCLDLWDEKLDPRGSAGDRRFSWLLRRARLSNACHAPAGPVSPACKGDSGAIDCERRPYPMVANPA